MLQCETAPFRMRYLGVPRYYFHLYNDLTVEDEEGQDLPGIEAAREFALANVRELLAEEVFKGKITLSHRIDVADGEGRVLMTVPFRDAVAVQD